MTTNAGPGATIITMPTQRTVDPTTATTTRRAIRQVRRAIVREGFEGSILTTAQRQDRRQYESLTN